MITSDSGWSRGVGTDAQTCERRDAAFNRERIQEVARRLIEDGGFEAISVSRVADEAGVGKGTIYRRFGDWAGLMRVLLDDSVRDLQEAVESGPPPLGPGAPPGD